MIWQPFSFLQPKNAVPLHAYCLLYDEYELRFFLLKSQLQTQHYVSAELSDTYEDGRLLNALQAGLRLFVDTNRVEFL